MITTSVTAVTTRRVVQFMPRLTHQSSAQPITTGTMISGCKGCPVAVQREPLELRAPKVTAPPTKTQVLVPSTFTKPGP
jgi:hypothetical protein